MSRIEKAARYQGPARQPSASAERQKVYGEAKRQKDTANAGHADRGGDVLLVQGAPGAARKREINRVDIFEI